MLRYEVRTLDLISKKELLAVTGISYGQLYRWKRERLIPEEWFIKQSAYTGQETFFPRQQILSRVQTILDAKDQYTLEELARRLSPESDPGFCSAEALASMEEIDPVLLEAIASLFGKERYSLSEAALFAAVTQARRALDLSPGEAGLLLGRAASAARAMPQTGDAALTVLRAGDGLHVLLSKTASPVAVDGALTVLGAWDLGELAGKLKLNHRAVGG